MLKGHSPDQMRCFVGIAVGSDVAACVGAMRSAISQRDPRWNAQKWVRDSNLHITVRFIGELGESTVGEVNDRLAAATITVAPFALTATRLSARRSPHHAGLLWVDFDDPTRRFEVLVRTVDEVCDATGVAYDSRPQRPHLTVCRTRAPLALGAGALGAANAVLSEAGVIVSVPVVSLFISRLAPGGPEYRTVGTWRLRGE